MELAEVRISLSFNVLSGKAAFTNRWQSSKVPSTDRAVMFSPRVVNCFSCSGLTSPLGKSICTCIPGTFRKPFATALPVSPEVATRT